MADPTAAGQDLLLVCLGQSVGPMSATSMRLDSNEIRRCRRILKHAVSVAVVRREVSGR